jgi:hypothetical protein
MISLTVPQKKELKEARVNDLVVSQGKAFPKEESPDRKYSFSTRTSLPFSERLRIETDCGIST